MAPPNDSDNRSVAVFVGNGGRVGSGGWAVGVGGGGATFFGGCAATDFFELAGEDIGVVVDWVDNEINATSIVRKGCSLFV